MGYETTLLIGRTGCTGDEMVCGPLTIDGDDAYYPWMREGMNGDFMTTGRKQTHFMIYATVDLCKCGDSALHELDRVNKDKDHFYYWFHRRGNNIEEKEDMYGDELRPVPISEVVQALEKDLAEEDYRRFRWALVLLKEMEKEREDIKVLIYGH